MNSTGYRRFSDRMPVAELGASVIAALLVCLLPVHTEGRAETLKIDSSGYVEKIVVGDLYAVVVGVRDYKEKNIPDLQVSDKDAHDFAKLLKSPSKLFKNAYVKVLVNDKATRPSIGSLLENFLPKARENDTVIIFLSGHATIADSDNETYFLPHDTDRDNLRYTALGLSGRGVFKGLNCRRALLIVDACHAAGIGTGSSSGSQGWGNLPSGAGGRAMILSSQSHEKSYEKPEEYSNSIFTHFLIKALQGEADRDRNGVVNMDEAYQYVYHRTKEATDNRQEPMRIGAISGTFPLAYRERGPAPIIKIARADLELTTHPGAVNVEMGTRRLGRSDAKGILIVNQIEVGKPYSLNLTKKGYRKKTVDLIIPKDLAGGVFKVGKTQLTLAKIDRDIAPRRVMTRIERLEKLAAQGNLNAKYDLGMEYYEGEDVAKDQRRAAALFKEAARGGMAASRAILGEMYMRGQGVKKNPVEAAKWIKLAAEQGLARSQALLGKMYYSSTLR